MTLSHHPVLQSRTAILDSIEEEMSKLEELKEGLIKQLVEVQVRLQDRRSTLLSSH